MSCERHVGTSCKRLRPFSLFPLHQACANTVVCFFPPAPVGLWPATHGKRVFEGRDVVIVGSTPLRPDAVKPRGLSACFGQCDGTQIQPTTPKLPCSAAIYSYPTPQSWNIITRDTADTVKTKLHGKPAVNTSTHVPPTTTLWRARWLATSTRYMASWRQWPHPDRSFVKDECARHVFAAESLALCCYRCRMQV